jgi:hypothetical protein
VAASDAAAASRIGFIGIISLSTLRLWQAKIDAT